MKDIISLELISGTLLGWVLNQFLSWFFQGQPLIKPGSPADKVLDLSKVYMGQIIKVSVFTLLMVAFCYTAFSVSLSGNTVYMLIMTIASFLFGLFGLAVEIRRMIRLRRNVKANSNET